MSTKHPVIAVTGSSGAGTTSVKYTFTHIFRREGINATFIEGDSYHRFDREEMKKAISKSEENGGRPISHFGPEANLFGELEQLFKQYGETGAGKVRRYLHYEEEAAPFNQSPGTFTPWESIEADTEALFYEGLHGSVVDDDTDAGRYADLLIGVVPIVNLEWIQKMHRDTNMRGYSTEAVTQTILRRMHDYVHYIVPQFARTHVNFQRVPLVDTSNPFVARHIPAPDESMLVVRFADPRGIDFPYLLSMIDSSFMSRANTIVCPGGKMDLAMQLIFTPMVWRLVERKRKGQRAAKPAR